jgi:hypothetical protein
MTEKRNRILAAVLALQVLAAVIIFWPSPATAGGGEPLFPELDANEVTAVNVTDGSDGSSIALAKDQGAWALPDADYYPADETKVAELLNKIAGLTAGRLVARAETGHGRLQVAEDDFVRRVEIQTEDGTEHLFFLGSSPSYGSSHVRLAGESETYLCEGISSWEIGAGASSWIDTSYQSVPFDEVRAITLENENGAFHFTRGEDEEWTSTQVGEGETVIQTGVTSAASQARSISIKEPLGKAELASYGMDSPLAQVTLSTEDEEITLIVGAQDPDDSTYVVLSSQSDYYARVYEYTVSNLVGSTREDFFEPLSTPTPEPTATSEAEESTATPESAEESVEQ